MRQTALFQTPFVSPAANAPEAYPHDRVLQPGRSLAGLWATAGLLRTDITTGFNGMAGTAVGIPLDLNLCFRSASGGQTALARHAVYVWHADAAGQYSVFNRIDTNYLRGIGITDARGRVRFRTIYPGTYRGRPPHIHFEVYRNLDALGMGASRLIRSRILLPDAVSRSIYAGSAAYHDSFQRYNELMFDLPVTHPEHDHRAVQVATVSTAGRGELRASLNVHLDPLP